MVWLRAIDNLADLKSQVNSQRESVEIPLFLRPMNFITLCLIQSCQFMLTCAMVFSTHGDDQLTPANFTQPYPIYVVEFATAHLTALRLEGEDKGASYSHQGIAEVLANTQVSIRLFGNSFTNHTVIRFSTTVKTRGYICDEDTSSKSYTISSVSLNSASAIVEASFPPSKPDEFYYICVRENDTGAVNDMPWIHQGPDAWLMIKAQQRLLPVWLEAILICLLLLFSGLFAGLTLGLLSLDTTALKILANAGERHQQTYAKTILPLRSRGNFLLCSLVLGNVLVNSSLTIILDDLTTGWIAVIMSTVAIVIFGEIIPQAICSRHGLAVGAKTIYVTKFFMCLTSPLAYPVSKLLDKILGEEIGSVYTRERLKELLNVTKDHHGLETEEVGIISGALDMKKKTVKEVMVPLEEVFMLPITAVLDFETFTFIESHGYSRIPVYENDRSNIVGLLNVKQLTLLDANDNIPLKTVIEYYENTLFFVFENTRLDYMFRTFREGNRGHMAFVQKINDEGPGDPFYQAIGLVTFEDVLEELLQAEIMDESDIGKQEARLTKRDPIKQFDVSKRKTKVCIEIQDPLALAAVQFLSTNAEPFEKEVSPQPK